MRCSGVEWELAFRVIEAGELIETARRVRQDDLGEAIAVALEEAHRGLAQAEHIETSILLEELKQWSKMVAFVDDGEFRYFVGQVGFRWLVAGIEHGEAAFLMFPEAVLFDKATERVEVIMDPGFIEAEFHELALGFAQ